MNANDQVNILLVDDQQAKLLAYEVMLAELGENLIKAGSGRQALELLLKNEIAVILVDVVMPDLDGFELAAMIRDHPRFQQTAIIFVSATNMTDLDRLRAYELGAVDYVPVPVIPELLRAKVRVFVDLYRKTRQLEQLNAELEQRIEERTAELAATNAELERRVEERTREREAAMAQVHEMQKMESLGQLTGGVAHDFNNLLMAVLGNLNLLRKRIPDDPRLRRLIDGALQGAERGATLTKRMLAFARRQELKPASIELPGLIDNMAEMLRRSLGPATHVTTSFQADLPPVRIDPNQLELAILNLALNARDAMPLGGSLAIGARWEDMAADNTLGLSPGAYVCMSVADTGTGMDDATLRRAIEPFFTTKGVGKGTGLGLSMVHGLAAQSGGIMRIASRMSEGTTVELWLPVSAAARSEPATATAAAGGVAPPCRVLLVDDDALILAGTAAMLEDLGHRVVEAGSAAAALDLLRNGTPVDLVVTDQAMPGMTGIELARQIREHWPGLPIILATGYADLPGGDDLNLPRLAKPYLQEELAAQIADLVATPVARVVPLGAARR